VLAGSWLNYLWHQKKLFSWCASVPKELLPSGFWLVWKGAQQSWLTAIVASGCAWSQASMAKIGALFMVASCNTVVPPSSALVKSCKWASSKCLCTWLITCCHLWPLRSFNRGISKDSFYKYSLSISCTLFHCLIYFFFSCYHLSFFTFFLHSSLFIKNCSVIVVIFCSLPLATCFAK